MEMLTRQSPLPMRVAATGPTHDDADNGRSR
jgi:hypothetical protein